MIKQVFLFMMLMSGAVALAANINISVKATVTDNRVAMGSGLAYTITVSGAQDLPAPQMPAIDGFDVRYSGPATRVAVINNSYSVEQSFNYVLVPLKEGKFTIPAVAVNINGLSLATEPIAVEVVAASSSEAAAAPGSDANIQQDVQSRLKLLMGVDRGKVYVGEGVPLTLRLYVNQLSLQDLSFPEISQEGFQLDPFKEPKQFQDILQGIDWHVVEFSTMLYPSKTGELVIAPALLKGALLFKNSDQNDRGGIFDQGFFSNFFSSYQKRPVTITSRELRLQVLPLPEEGKPADFSGAVGRYDLNVEASPLKVKAGDPVTLRMVLTGAGHIRDVKMPGFEAEGFKVYDPQIKDDADRKTLEQVIIPTDTKLTSIPAVSFSYFDTARGEYRTIVRGPFTLEVTAPAAGEEFQAVGFAQPSGVSAPETLGRDIVFIKDNPGHLVQKSGRHGYRTIFYIIFAVYLQVWAGLLAFYFYRQRLLNDPGLARQAAAAREAFGKLRTAQDRQRAGHTKAFYDELEGTLREYFVRRLDIPPGNADVAAVSRALRDLKVDEQYVTACADIYTAAEQVRFAGMAVADDKMRTHLADAQDIIRAVERRAR